MISKVDTDSCNNSLGIVGSSVESNVATAFAELAFFFGAFLLFQRRRRRRRFLFTREVPGGSLDVSFTPGLLLVL